MPTKVYANVFPMEDAKAKTFVPVDVKADTKNLNSIEEKLSKQIPVNTKYSEQIVEIVREDNDGNEAPLSL